MRLNPDRNHCRDSDEGCAAGDNTYKSREEKDDDKQDDLRRRHIEIISSSKYQECSAYPALDPQVRFGNHRSDYSCDFTRPWRQSKLSLMRQTAAVMCRDNRSLATLQAALSKLDMLLLPCQSGEEALEKVIAKNCSTLIVDFDLPGAQEVVRMAALLPPAQKPTLLAVASRAWPGTGEAFHSGASRILYRPIAEEQVTDALQTGKKPAQSKQRKAERYEMKALVHLECDSRTITAISIDISEHGLAVQASEPVPMNSELAFRCTLPGSDFALQGHAEVAWAGDHGRAGMFFSKLSPAARKHLKHWLGRRSASNRAHRSKAEHSVRGLLPPDDAKAEYATGE